MPVNVEKLKKMIPPKGMDFHISKIGHLVLQVTDLERSTEFYIQILGFKVSDVYPEDMMPGGMVFLRCNTDHHCLALVGAAKGRATNNELHHFAFEVPSLAEVIRARDRLRAHNVPIDFEGRRRAGCQIAVEFRDPDNHSVEIYWGVDQVGSDGRVRPASEWHGVKSLDEAIAHPVPGQDTYLPR
ncbi:MAG TPA: VOC family protein [Candidatus Binatia bacterium]|nr:VOC family protein [Candidatus Binatia bacterium]